VFAEPPTRQMTWVDIFQSGDRGGPDGAGKRARAVATAVSLSLVAFAVCCAHCLDVSPCVVVVRAWLMLLLLLLLMASLSITIIISLLYRCARRQCGCGGCGPCVLWRRALTCHRRTLCPTRRRAARLASAWRRCWVTHCAA
jgi:hypothetical protein